MLKNVQEKTLDWTPRPHQLMMYYYDKVVKFDEEHSVFVANHTWHRRGGKTTGGRQTIQKKCVEILGEDKVFQIRKGVDSSYPNIGFLAETKENARNIIWNELVNATSVFPSVKANNNRLVITIPRPHIGDVLEIRLMSLRDHNRIRGGEYRYIHVDEAQMMTEAALKFSIFATLTDCSGQLQTTGTATSVGYYKKYIAGCISRGTYCTIVPVTMTDWKTPKELEILERDVGSFAYRQEYLCDFDVSTNTAFWNNRLTELERDKSRFFSGLYDNGNAKILAVDIGVGKGFAAWSAQVSHDNIGINIRDYHSDYEVLAHLRNDLLETDNMPDVIILPHDSSSRRLEATKPRTTKKVFKEIFPESQIIPLNKPANNQKFMQIQNVTENLSMLRFPPEEASTDAHIGLSHIKQYRRAESRDGSPTNQVYKGDGSDHAGDALVHLFEGLKISQGRVKKPPTYRATHHRLSYLPRHSIMDDMMPSKGNIKDIYA